MKVNRKWLLTLIIFCVINLIYWRAPQFTEYFAYNQQDAYKKDIETLTKIKKQKDELQREMQVLTDRIQSLASSGSNSGEMADDIYNLVHILEDYQTQLFELENIEESLRKALNKSLQENHLQQEEIDQYLNEIELQNQEISALEKLIEDYKKTNDSITTPEDLENYLAKIQHQKEEIEYLETLIKENHNNFTHKGRFIFSINSGRSGSGYLSEILSCAKNVDSHHEDNPPMCCQNLKSAALLGLEETYNDRYEKKIPFLKKQISHGTIYADTSHLFIKTFFDVTIDALRNTSRIDVIILRRYLPDVIYSYHRLESFEFQNLSKDYKGSSYYHSPNSRLGMITPLGQDSELTVLERAIGYAIDIEAHAQWFLKTYPSIRTLEIRLEDLQTLDGVLLLFQRLDLEPDFDKLEKVVGKVVNNKGSVTPGAGTMKEEYLQAILDYREKSEKRGIVLPPLPHLGYITYPSS